MRRLVLIWCLVIWCLPGMWSAHGQERATYKFGETPLPYRVAWGPYTVSVEGARKHPTIGRRVRILDRKGRSLREVDAFYVGQVDFLDLDGSGVGELRVAAEPDNNIVADRRTFCFTRRGRLHNVLVMPSEFDRLQDLGHDGRPELLSKNWAPLEYVGDLCHACSPPIYLILRWN